MAGDGKESAPPGSKNSWISGMLDKKADEKWVLAKIEPIEELAKEAKAIALSAKKSALTPHECNEEETLDRHDEAIVDLVKTLNGWRNIKISAVVSVVGLIVIVVANYFSLKGSIEDNQNGLKQVRGEVAVVREQVQKVKSIVEEDREKQDEENEQQITEIKKAIKDAIEAQAKIEPKKKRR